MLQVRLSLYAHHHTVEYFQALFALLMCVYFRPSLPGSCIDSKQSGCTVS